MQQQLQVFQNIWVSEVAMGPECRSRLRQDSLSEPNPESKICEKPNPGPESLFNFGKVANGNDQYYFIWLSQQPGVRMVVYWVKTCENFGLIDGTAGVWTGVGFSKLKNFRTEIRVQKFWNRSGVGVWKSDYGHLCWVCCRDGTGC